MNVKLLRKIQKHILDEPLRFAMGQLAAKGTPGTKLGKQAAADHYNAYNRFERLQRFPKCGTIACISGWADILDPCGKITVMTSGALCAAGNWPTKFRARYRKAKTPLTRARIAAERIDHFIKTKGAE